MAKTIFDTIKELKHLEIHDSINELIGFESIAESFGQIENTEVIDFKQFVQRNDFNEEIGIQGDIELEVNEEEIKISILKFFEGGFKVEYFKYDENGEIKKINLGNYETENDYED